MHQQLLAAIDLVRTLLRCGVSRRIAAFDKDPFGPAVLAEDGLVGKIDGQLPKIAADHEGDRHPASDVGLPGHQHCVQDLEDPLAGQFRKCLADRNSDQGPIAHEAPIGVIDELKDVISPAQNGGEARCSLQPTHLVAQPAPFTVRDRAGDASLPGRWRDRLMTVDQIAHVYAPPR